MFLEIGDLEAAIGAAREAVAVYDRDAQIHFVLAEALEKAGHCDEAISSYRKALDLQEEDRLGAGVRLSVLGAMPVPDRLPGAYVEALFDDYAPRFEKSLQRHLAYRTPEQLCDLLQIHAHLLAAQPAILDLGCGTGLAGAALRSIAHRLEGIDLSEKMLQLAEQKKVYDHLQQGDIEVDLSDDAPRFDVVVAADVFNYFGDLTTVLRRAAYRLRPDGLLLFSVELGQTNHDMQGYHLHTGQRYAHNRLSVLGWLSGCGFEVIDEAHATLRKEKGKPVPGLLLLARLRSFEQPTFYALNEGPTENDLDLGSETTAGLIM